MFTKTEIDLIVTSQLDSLLWSEGEEYDETGEFTGNMWDELYSADDATPELHARLWDELVQWEDVEYFGVSKHDEMIKALETYVEHFGDSWAGQFGHDLALTRNRHGAGFWDRGLGDAGYVLTDWAHMLGELQVFHGHYSIHSEWNGMFHAE